MTARVSTIIRVTAAGSASGTGDRSDSATSWSSTQPWSSGMGSSNTDWSNIPASANATAMR